MTNDEVIYELSVNVDYKTPQIQEACQIAIKTLEQQPCDDAVSRQAVLDTLDKMDKALDDDRTVENYKALLTECYKDLPPVTPKPKTGWHIAHGMYEDRFWCSCGFIKVMDSEMSEWKYCPICGGARMVSE